MYEKVDIGDPFNSDSSWTDEAYSFDYSLNKGKKDVTFRTWFENQTVDGDPMGSAYGRCCFVYAARWARRIENALERGARLTQELIDQTDQETDQSTGMGVSGMQHGFAVSVLIQTWIHGKAMLKWKESNGG